VTQDPQESAFGLQPNIAAGIASFFGWIGGLIVLLGKPPQQWVRFVAVQSILLAVAYVIFAVALAIISMFIAFIPGVRAIILPVVSLVHLVAALAVFIAWLVVTIKAFQGQAQRLPIIAEYADRWASPAATPLT
jgi:uncharacterized membrane protein